MRLDTPALRLLAGAYFHQDWMIDSNDEWAVLREFVDGEPHLAPDVPREVAEVLARFPTEGALEEYLRGLGSYYTTSPEEGGYRGWLIEIARRVSEGTGQT